MVWFSVYKLTPNLFKAIGVTKYINPKIHSEGSFHVLYDKLDKLVGQCQAVNSHSQIRVTCKYDIQAVTNQILMIENPESQRSPEIFLE